MLHRGQSILGDYEVVRELGRGGMATVYLLRHLDTGQEWAVKVPHEDWVTSASERAVFAAEVQTWISLPPHPHIVQCFFVREFEGRPLVFAEFVSSGTLEDWMSRDRIHGIAHVLDLCIQLAEAMRVAQEAGVVHRDLKPANCLMEASGLLKLSDFGLATAKSRLYHQRGAGADQTTDRPGIVHGTAAYCSPEQFDGELGDSRTDVWAFAVTLLELLTGTRPAFGPAARGAAEAFQSQHPDNRVPKGVWDFVFDLLREDCALRPTSFADLRDRLQDLYGHVSRTAYPREFPAAQIPAASPLQAYVPSRSRTAHVLLRRTLEQLGRDPGEADRFTVPNPAGRRAREADDLAAVSILTEAVRLYRSSAGGSEGKFAAELAVVLQSLGESHRRLGNPSAAADALWCEAEYLRSLLAKDRAPDLALRLVGCLQDAAVCLRQSGHEEQAILRYDEAITSLQRLGRHNSSALLANLLAGLHQNRSMALLKALRLQPALADSDRAVVIRRRLVEQMNQTGYLADLAGTLSNRGLIHRHLGHNNAALEDYDEAERLCQRPNVTGLFVSARDVLITVFLNRSALRLAMNDARSCRADAEQLRQLIEDDRSPSPDLLFQLSMAYNNLAEACRRVGEISAALQASERCIGIRERLIQQHGLTHLSNYLARAQANRVLQLLEAGRIAEALESADQALASLGRFVTRRQASGLIVDHAWLRSLRGICRVISGQVSSGRSDLIETLDELESALPNASADLWSRLLETLEMLLACHASGPTNWQLADPFSTLLSAASISGDATSLEAVRRACRCLQRVREDAMASGKFPVMMAARLQRIVQSLLLFASHVPEVHTCRISTLVSDLTRHASASGVPDARVDTHN